MKTFDEIISTDLSYITEALQRLPKTANTDIKNIIVLKFCSYVSNSILDTSINNDVNQYAAIDTLNKILEQTWNEIKGSFLCYTCTDHQLRPDIQKIFTQTKRALYHIAELIADEKKLDPLQVLMPSIAISQQIIRQQIQEDDIGIHLINQHVENPDIKPGMSETLNDYSDDQTKSEQVEPSDETHTVDRITNTTNIDTHEENADLIIKQVVNTCIETIYSNSITQPILDQCVANAYDQAQAKQLNQYTQLENIVNNHILSEDHTTLYPVESVLYDIFSSGWLNKTTNITYRSGKESSTQDWTMSKNDREKLLNHSEQMREIVSIKQSLQLIEKDKSNLLGQIIHLCQQFYVYSIDGIGTELYAEHGVHQVITDFMLYYQNLSREGTCKIPEKVQVQIDIISKLYLDPQRTKQENKNINLSVHERCLATRRNDLLNAIKSHETTLEEISISNQTKVSQGKHFRDRLKNKVAKLKYDIQHSNYTANHTLPITHAILDKYFSTLENMQDNIDDLSIVLSYFSAELIKHILNNNTALTNKLMNTSIHSQAALCTNLSIHQLEPIWLKLCEERWFSPFHANKVFAIASVNTINKFSFLIDTFIKKSNTAEQFKYKTREKRINEIIGVLLIDRFLNDEQLQIVGNSVIREMIQINNTFSQTIEQRGIRLPPPDEIKGTTDIIIYLLFHQDNKAIINEVIAIFEFAEIAKYIFRCERDYLSTHIQQNKRFALKLLAHLNIDVKNIQQSILLQLSMTWVETVHDFKNILKFRHRYSGKPQLDDFAIDTCFKKVIINTATLNELIEYLVEQRYFHSSILNLIFESQLEFITSHLRVNKTLAVNALMFYKSMSKESKQSLIQKTIQNIDDLIQVIDINLKIDEETGVYPLDESKNEIREIYITQYVIDMCLLKVLNNSADAEKFLNYISKIKSKCQQEIIYTSISIDIISLRLQNTYDYLSKNKMMTINLLAALPTITYCHRNYHKLIKNTIQSTDDLHRLLQLTKQVYIRHYGGSDEHEPTDKKIIDHVTKTFKFIMKHTEKQLIKKPENIQSLLNTLLEFCIECDAQDYYKILLLPGKDCFVNSFSLFNQWHFNAYSNDIINYDDIKNYINMLYGNRSIAYNQKLSIREKRQMLDCTFKNIINYNYEKYTFNVELTKLVLAKLGDSADINDRVYFLLLLFKHRDNLSLDIKFLLIGEIQQINETIIINVLINIEHRLTVYEKLRFITIRDNTEIYSSPTIQNCIKSIILTVEDLTCMIKFAFNNPKKLEPLFSQTGIIECIAKIILTSVESLSLFIYQLSDELVFDLPNPSNATYVKLADIKKIILHCMLDNDITLDDIANINNTKHEDNNITECLFTILLNAIENNIMMSHRASSLITTSINSFSNILYLLNLPQQSTPAQRMCDFNSTIESLLNDILTNTETNDFEITPNDILVFSKLTHSLSIAGCWEIINKKIDRSWFERYLPKQEDIIQLFTSININNNTLHLAIQLLHNIIDTSVLIMLTTPPIDSEISIDSQKAYAEVITSARFAERDLTPEQLLKIYRNTISYYKDSAEAVILNFLNKPSFLNRFSTPADFLKFIIAINDINFTGKGESRSKLHFKLLSLFKTLFISRITNSKELINCLTAIQSRIIDMTSTTDEVKQSIYRQLQISIILHENITLVDSFTTLYHIITSIDLMSHDPMKTYTLACVNIPLGLVYNNFSKFQSVFIEHLQNITRYLMAKNNYCFVINESIDLNKFTEKIYTNEFYRKGIFNSILDCYKTILITDLEIRNRLTNGYKTGMPFQFWGYKNNVKKHTVEKLLRLFNDLLGNGVTIINNASTNKKLSNNTRTTLIPATRFSADEFKILRNGKLGQLFKKIIASPAKCVFYNKIIFKTKITHRELETIVEEQPSNDIETTVRA